MNKTKLRKIIKEEIQKYLTEGHASQCKQMLDDGEISPDQYQACVDHFEKDYGEVEDTGARPMAEAEKWIQSAEKDIEKRGTEGVCTGDKYGSPSCPPGSKRYNLAKTFRKMAKKRKKK